MKSLVWCIALALPLLQTEGQAKQKHKSLSGWMVVVDPGHGGTDPGSFRMLNGIRVLESQYVYDVSLRVARIIREHGGLAFMTTKSEVGERNLAPSEIFPDDRTATFALDNSVVKAGTTGLEKRVAYGNKLGKKYANRRQAWISIHFDVVGTNSSIEGVRIICADDSSKMVKAMKQRFDAAHRLREQDAVVMSGDKDHGIRHLLVLGRTNHIRDRVLIELGNFNNDADVWRIRDYRVREKYAEEIVEALERS